MQQNKIKILNQKVKRFKKDISSLKLLMSHLKQQKILSEDVHNNILVIFDKILN